MLATTEKPTITKRTRRSHRKKQPRFMRVAKKISYGLGWLFNLVIIPLLIEFLKGALRLPTK